MLIHLKWSIVHFLTIWQEAAHLNSSKRATWEREGSATLSLSPSITSCSQNRETEMTLNFGKDPRLPEK